MKSDNVKSVGTVVSEAIMRSSTEEADDYKVVKLSVSKKEEKTPEPELTERELLLVKATATAVAKGTGVELGRLLGQVMHAVNQQSDEIKKIKKSLESLTSLVQGNRDITKEVRGAVWDLEKQGKEVYKQTELIFRVSREIRDRV